MLKVYTYAKCSTCRKATKWLEAQGISFDEHPIRDTPPTKAELRAMHKATGGEIRKLFNTSGLAYRAMGLKSKLPDMSQAEALDLLATNGNLVKRPFALDKESGQGAVGFDESIWNQFS